MMTDRPVVSRSRIRRLRALRKLLSRRAALRRRRRPKILTPVACLAIACLCAYAASRESPRNEVAGLMTDLSVGLRVLLPPAPQMAADASVVVVGLDAKTLNHPDHIETPRVLMNGLWADAVKTGLDHGARGAVFDIVFSFAAPPGRSDLQDALSAFDKPLEETFAFERERIVIARTERFEPSRRFSGFFFTGGIALAELPVDADDRIRLAPSTLSTIDDGEVPTLMGEALLRIDKRAEAPDEVHLTPPFRIATLPSASLLDVLACDDPSALRALFDSRIVVLGGALEIEDQVRTADRFIAADDAEQAPDSPPCDFAPIRAGTPGVFAHAAAIDGVLRGWAPLRSEKPGGRLAIALTFCFALVAALMVSYFGAVIAAVASFVAAPAIFVAFSAYSIQQGVAIAFAAPVMAAPLAFCLALAFKIWIVDYTRRLLRDQFAHYLSPEVINEMVEEERLPKLGGEIRTITVMFVDLSGFTSFAEDESNGAAYVMRVLNEHLSVIADAVHAYGGYVDKFIGDAVMAIWNAPNEVKDHAALAVGAALQIRQEIAGLGRPGRPAMKVKIGIESGDANVGNVGATDRLSYTAVGDIVNLSARLEGANSRFKAGILVGPTASAECARHDGPTLVRIATITVKGREHSPTVISTPIGADDEAITAPHAMALQAFEAGDFDHAAEIWQGLPEDAPWAGQMAQEARDAAKEEGEWNGRIDLTQK